MKDDSNIDELNNLIDQQERYDKCISKNLNANFSDLAQICDISNSDDFDFNCNAYFQNDPNNRVESEVKDGRCIIIKQDVSYMKKYADQYNNCKFPQNVFVRLYDKNGNILTYNKDKNNKGWVKYQNNIFNTYPTAVQLNALCA
jgi:hypothetical protein